MAMLSNAVPGEAAANQAAAQVCHTTALQLLLRLLPFKQSATKDSTAQQLQHNRHMLLEELHKHPLWRYSSLDQRSVWQPAQRSVALPNTHGTLLDYIKLAAEADEAQRTSVPHRYRRNSPPTAAEVAAELHAVYALAAVHAASQQQRNVKQPAQQQQLTSSDFLALLKAYAALSEQPASSPNEGSVGEHNANTGRWQGEGAAAAVHALYAFAALAESQQQQAPGQLQVGACSPSAAASRCTGSTGKHQPGPLGEAGGYHIGSSGAEQQELEVLLKLAQLGAES